ncbi:MAG TPA: hypothetical protein VHC20_00670, partial [Candidatus Paceibacterota bacterium]|nr:hypothetical protein [Candidatus Paceibacterota bacterium]
SLRAVYKAVDHLIEAGVLLKVRQRVMVDQEWAREVSTKLAPPLSAPLGPGEKAIYTFTSIAHLDAFWKTIVLQLEAYEQDGLVMFYNPHNFWAYVPERRESEDAYYRHFSASKIHAFFTIGGETAADMQFKRAYQDDFFQVDARNMPGYARNVHLTVMGDYLITVRLPKALADRIDRLYETGRPIEELLPAIMETCQSPGNIRFVLEHNPQKVKKLRRPLSLNFYFKMN